jgi:hypothetical protein
MADGKYVWTNAVGRRLTVTADSSGSVAVIDVLAGEKDKGLVQLPAEPPQLNAVFGETNHMAYDAPYDASQIDDCGSSLTGKPCWVFSLPGEVDLVVNFGKDSGFADGYLSEVILGKREALALSGQILQRGVSH